MKILLIDDSEDTGLLIKFGLTPYKVDQAFTILEAHSMLSKEQYLLLLIDVSLPDGDGFSLCTELSQSGPHRAVPKILVTAKAQMSEKIYGLNCGADDYITKPFEMAELKARVDARLRGMRNAASRIEIKGDFEFDPDFQRCFWVGTGQRKDLELTPTEFRIFKTLAFSDQPLSREELVRAIWVSNGLNIAKRGIDSHVAHLRKKLEPYGEYVISIYGKGYAFCHQIPFQRTG